MAASVDCPTKLRFANTSVRKKMTKWAKGCPMALVSGCYEVLNDLLIDARIAPLTVGERDLAADHLAASRDDDLWVYDPGYPAFWIFALHAHK